MSFDRLVAGFAVLAAIGAGAAGLVAHLCWLAVSAPRELVAALGIFARVVIG